MKYSVKAKLNAKEEKVEQVAEGQFVVSVKKPPVQGQANAAIIKALQEYFHTKSVRIISGRTSRNKIVKVGD